MLDGFHINDGIQFPIEIINQQGQPIFSPIDENHGKPINHGKPL
jgi:hypothetical protein